MELNSRLICEEMSISAGGNLKREQFCSEIWSQDISNMQKISMIDDKEKLVSTGVIFVAGEETSVSSSRFSKMTKLNLSKIWMQKREDARKRLQEILENRNSQGINKITGDFTWMVV